MPITTLLDQPLHDLTRISAELLGTVILYLDYAVPLEPIRRKLNSILETSSHWDQRVKVLQLTDATDHTVQVRALVSAPDADQAWSLRCEVREKLLQFLQQEHPHSLPRARIG